MAGRSRKGLWKKLVIAIGTLLVLYLAGLALLVAIIPTYEIHRPLLDLQDSHLMTPRGPVSFEFSNRSAHYPADEKSAGKTIFAGHPASGTAPGFTLYTFLLNWSGTVAKPRMFLSGTTSDYDSAKVAVQPGAFYQINQETSIPLTVTVDLDHYRGDDTSQAPSYFKFDWPSPLSGYNVTLSGGTMPDRRAAKVEAGEEDSHYLYVPFRIGADEFSIHLRFRVLVHSFERRGR